MNIKTLAFPLLMLNVLICTSPTLAQTISVEPTKSSYVLGEPVYITVSVENDSAERCETPAELNPDAGGTIILITGPDGQTRPFVPLSFYEHDEPAQNLEPGENVAEAIAIFYGRDGWTFNQPGSYRVVAKAMITRGGDSIRVESQAAAIEVDHGPAHAGQLVANEKASEEAGKYLLWLSGEHLTTGIELLRSIAHEESGSVLASYIELAFGWDKSRSFANYQKGIVRPPDNEVALAHLEKAQDEHLPPRLQLQKSLAQASCYIRMGETGQVRDALENASRLIDDYPALTDMSEQLDRLIKATDYNPKAE